MYTVCTVYKRWDALQKVDGVELKQGCDFLNYG